MDEWMLNDLLECSVCLERLDTSSKVLPCQHTFCKKCLEEIVYTHKELRCPECRVLVDIGIDDLPPNVLLMRILEGMKNAPKRTSVTTETVNVANHSRSSTVSAYSVNSRVRSRSSNRPGPDYAQDSHQPYAIAKCDCVPKEPGDLGFKRGDVILLRRKIEQRWYQGECNGVLGVFPLSYVQVVVPLSSHAPQCKALYDFGKCHEDDDGCLHFSKGDVINVIRRIDENWAEGKLDERIGIFPITFVEMNNLAKNLMKTSLNSSSTSSRDAPPTPTDESAPLLSNEGTSFANASPSQISEGLTLFSPSSSSSSTSTATTSPTSSESTTTPSSPSTSPSAVPHTQTAPIKRHSYTPGAQPPPYHAPPAVHRHSAEILKPEESAADTVIAEQRTGYQKDSKPRQQRSSPPSLQHLLLTSGSSLEETPTRPTHHRRKTQVELPAPESTREPQYLSLTSKQTNGNPMFQRQSSLRISKSTLVHSKLIEPPPLPSMYIAIYPYKPQKTDELELKIGCIYTVVERCQDGWFKGNSHPNPQCGVFPGNYVTPLRSLPMLQNQLESLVHNSPRHDTRTSSDSRMINSSTKTSSNAVVSSSIASPNCVAARLAPPELPARSISPILGSNRSHKISTTTWHVPTCGVLEKYAFSTPPVVTKSRSKNVTPESNGTSPRTNEAKTPKSAERSKDKKEKVSVSLMRRLTSMKKSRSPPPASTYSIDNPVFEDGGGSSTFAPIAHARSDSCPSQLLSFSSQTHATSSSSNHHANLVGGSQRVKHKLRASLQNHSRRTFDSNTSVFSSPSSTKLSKEDKPVISHRKSSSLDTTVYEERETQLGKSKPVDPPPRERYRCITPYPPNSEFELELRIGDIIYVHKKRDDGWYRGTLQRNGRTGLFPVSFVESLP